MIYHGSAGLGGAGGGDGAVFAPYAKRAGARGAVPQRGTEAFEIRGAGGAGPKGINRLVHRSFSLALLFGSPEINLFIIGSVFLQIFLFLHDKRNLPSRAVH